MRCLQVCAGVILAIWLALAPAASWAGSMMLLGAGGPSGAVAYSGPADINGAPAGFWGLRAMSAAYANSTGNLAILVASAATGGYSVGTTVCTLKAATTGAADLSAYCTNAVESGVTPVVACGHATSCVISQLYDQSGAGNHLTQATQASRPPIVFNSLNGNPSITISGATYLLFGGSLTVAQPFTEAMVAERTSGTTAARIFDDNTGRNLGFGGGANLWIITASGSTTPTFTASDGVVHSVQAVYDFVTNSTNSSTYVDGTITSSLNVGASTSFGTLPVAGRGVAGDVGLYSEIGIWSGSKLSNYSAVCKNQSLFWKGSIGSC